MARKSKPSNAGIIARMRGEFLDQTWRIERRVSRLLAQTLAPVKAQRDVLLSVILGHMAMTFSVKSAMLADVVKVIPIQGVDQAFLKILKSVREFRNDLAHSVFSSESTKEQVILISIKGGKLTKIPLRVDVLTKRLKMARVTVKLLDEILSLQKES